jgi:glyoxylase-like metal-dependent hydrolase (beta-lactamase superfamily II)
MQDSPMTEIPSFTIGKIEMSLLSDGAFRLDGGAMFGIVPKTLWAKRAPADRKNRITLGASPLLVRAGGRNILVDTGLGDKYTQKDRTLFAIERPPSLAEQLAQTGLSHKDIDAVVLTHLHFDHCGGNTAAMPERGIVPSFPNAKYYVQKQEWEDANTPSDRARASYRGENFVPLMDAGLLELLEGNRSLFDGVEVVVTGGHTRGHQCVLLRSGGKTAVYWADLVPTTAHINLSYIMAYDVLPLDTLSMKRKLLAEAANGGWLAFFEHEPDPRKRCGTLRRLEKGYGFTGAF